MSPRLKSKKQPIFGRRLEELRKSRNLTQAELAEKVGLSRGTIAYYEASAQNPTIDTVQTLADFFGVTVQDLIKKRPKRAIKPGPTSRLEQQVERIKRLSPAKQRMITNMLEGVLSSD